MNKIILEAIKKTGSGSDGHFTVEDVKAGVEVGNVDIWGNVGDATDAPFIEVEGSTTANTGLIV